MAVKTERENHSCKWPVAGGFLVCCWQQQRILTWLTLPYCSRIDDRQPSSSLHLNCVVPFPGFKLYKVQLKLSCVWFHCLCRWSTGIRGLVRLGDPPPRLPGVFSGRRQYWENQGELVVSNSVECDTFPFSALVQLVGHIRPVKRWILFC